MSVKALIFDCFGVLYHGARSYVVNQAAPDARSRIGELFDQADYGMISTQEFVEQVAETMQMTVHDVKAMLASQYRRNEALVARLEGLRPQYKVGLLSNVNDTLIYRLFTEDELTRFFDAVVMSSSVGMIKPYPEIYELTANRLDVLPEECIMIDDLLVNIEGAKAVGMDGIVYQSLDQCAADLHAKGIEI